MKFLLRSLLVLTLTTLVGCGFGSGGVNDSSLLNLTTSVGALDPIFANDTGAPARVANIDHRVRPQLDLLKLVSRSALAQRNSRQQAAQEAANRAALAIS